MPPLNRSIPFTFNGAAYELKQPWTIKNPRVRVLLAQRKTRLVSSQDITVAQMSQLDKELDTYIK